MLKVKTIVKDSKIHGKGLFADEFIPKGTIIWQFEHNIDKVITHEEFLALESKERDFWNIYSFRFNEKYYLCMDDAIYFNHNEIDYNCDEDPENNTTIAKFDINPGEELTTNYANFGTTQEDYIFNYLSLKQNN